MSTNSFEHLIDGCSCQGKTCSKCCQKQCLHAFGSDKRRPDGFHGHCTPCRKATRAKRNQTHPEITYVIKHNHRARKNKVAATLTPQEWLDLKALYNYRCLCCSKQEPEITLTIDHVIPISKGGTSTLANIQPLCLACNGKKRAKTVDYRHCSNRTDQTAQANT